MESQHSHSKIVLTRHILFSLTINPDYRYLSRVKSEKNHKIFQISVEAETDKKIEPQESSKVLFRKLFFIQRKGNRVQFSFPANFLTPKENQSKSQYAQIKTLNNSCKHITHITHKTDNYSKILPNYLSTLNRIIFLMHISYV